jgi:hypothetical protein
MRILDTVVKPLVRLVLDMWYDLALAAPYERNLSVIMRLSAVPSFFNRLINGRLAALVFRRFCTISSRTYPS